MSVISKNNKIGQVRKISIDTKTTQYNMSTEINVIHWIGANTVRGSMIDKVSAISSMDKTSRTGALYC